MASAQSVKPASRVRPCSPGPGDTLRHTGVAQSTKEAALHLDAHGLKVHPVLQLTHAAGGGQQRLGGDTAPIYAGASNIMALYHCCLQPLRHEPQRTEQGLSGYQAYTM